MSPALPKRFKAQQLPDIENVPKKSRLEVLLTLSKILQDLKISFFLVLGTCLGAVREGDFIAYDHDVDLAIHSDELSRLATEVSRLNARGIYIEEVTQSNLRLKVPGCDATFDLWVIYKAPVFYRLFGYLWWYNNGLFKRDYFKTPAAQVAQIGGHAFAVPHETEAYLVEHYGDTWRTPQKGMNAIYRGYLSQVINKLIFDSAMPSKFSGVNERLVFKPWASKILKTWFPKAALTNRYKHPVDDPL